ncbi:hypothetical protein M378DRAFT_11051 [Amanita muscaria Koide BX008]|uniref:F-box domain-containing protein n=1 Tax=Amanita muscaria (strain Koide BX008) TaxID=946122 RepID=A0A0C2TEF0_AMAMK|nr:hypothetical protein M378DRAFT_11051 [Amanita muscaria Koide BX008]
MASPVLPQDVFDEIISQLDDETSTLKSCSLVCRSPRNSPVPDCNSIPIERIETGSDRVARILKQVISHPWHEDPVLHFVGEDFGDFLQLREKLEEQRVLGTKPKLSYIAKSRCIMCTWPFPVHEVPLTQFGTLVQGFEPYMSGPTDILSIRTNTGDVDSETGDFTIPDLLLGAWSEADQANRYFVVVECAKSQSMSNARDAVKRQVAMHPAIVMAVIINVTESPRYSSPREGSGAWTRFKNNSAEILTMKEFMNLCTPSENFPREISVLDHSWCSIKDIEYHVWLKRQDQETINFDNPNITEYTSGFFPDSMTEVRSMMNEGFKRVNGLLQGLCKENAADANTSSLEGFQLQFPENGTPSFEKFEKKVDISFKEQAYLRFRIWFMKCFRGQKRCNDGILESEGGERGAGNS